MTGSGFSFIFLFFIFHIPQFPRGKPSGVPGYDLAERSAKKRPCAIFVGEGKKKRVRVGDFPTPERP